MSSSHDTAERVVRVTGQHWFRYVTPAFVYAVVTAMSIVLFFVAGFTAYHIPGASYVVYIVALIVFLFTHHWFFLTILGESHAKIIVTSRRVIWMHVRLFAGEEMREYAFDKMKTVEARTHGILQTIFRYGTLEFESGPGIPLVPHPATVAKDIEQAMGLC